MASYLVNDRTKCVLSLDGALALAKARGLTALLVTAHFQQVDVSEPAYEDLTYIKVFVFTGPTVTTVTVFKERIDEHRLAGNPKVWAEHPLIMAKNWASKIALGETFRFPLESSLGAEWPEIAEQVVEEIFSSAPDHDEAVALVFDEGREARRTAPTTGVRDVDCPYQSSDRRSVAWSDGYEAESIAIEAET